VIQIPITWSPAVNAFKSARLNLEQLSDRCVPSSLNFTKITMTAAVTSPRDPHTSISVRSPDATNANGSGGGGVGRVNLSAGGLEQSRESAISLYTSDTDRRTITVT
jgi:hypothetical protein